MKNVFFVVAVVAMLALTGCGQEVKKESEIDNNFRPIETVEITTRPIEVENIEVETIEIETILTEKSDKDF